METIKGQGREKHEEGMDKWKRWWKKNLWMWSYGVSRHLMGWNHQDKWEEAATWEHHEPKIRLILEEKHSFTTYTKVVQNFFTIISTSLYKGKNLLFIDLVALEKKKKW